jgi:membrane protease YdiL (CAAX protease family)
MKRRQSRLSRLSMQQYKKLTLLILPHVLTPSCTFVFKWAAAAYGSKSGYLIGFLFYWLFWCLFIPVKLIGCKTILQYFSLKWYTYNWQVVACLLVPLIFVYVYAFPSALQQADAAIIVLSLLISIINATAEEVLWRGVYLHIFKDNKWIKILFASASFALWHYAPQVVFVNKRPGGAHSFVLFSFCLGLCYAYVANKQQSILWTTVAHILFDFAGLGARVYF